MSKIAVFELGEVAVDTPGVTTLGDQIRQARERLQMTQTELAEAVGVAESTVSNWERGVVKAPKNRLARVRHVLKMDAATTVAASYATEEEAARALSDMALWAEATRRFFRNAEAPGPIDDQDYETSGDRGQFGTPPDNLLPPQSGERTEYDG